MKKKILFIVVGLMIPCYGKAEEAMDMYVNIRLRYNKLNNGNLKSCLVLQKSTLGAPDYAKKVAKIAHILDARGINHKGFTSTYKNTFDVVEKAVEVYEGMVTSGDATTKDKEALKKLLVASQNKNKRITPSRGGGSDIVANDNGGKTLYDCLSSWSPGKEKRDQLQSYYEKYLK